MSAVHQPWSDLQGIRRRSCSTDPYWTSLDQRIPVTTRVLCIRLLPCDDHSTTRWFPFSRSLGSTYPSSCSYRLWDPPCFDCSRIHSSVLRHSPWLESVRKRFCPEAIQHGDRPALQVVTGVSEQGEDSSISCVMHLVHLYRGQSSGIFNSWLKPWDDANIHRLCWVTLAPLCL